jgi:hypothetical protein
MCGYFKRDMRTFRTGESDVHASAAADPAEPSQQLAWHGGEFLWAERIAGTCGSPLAGAASAIGIFRMSFSDAQMQLCLKFGADCLACEDRLKSRYQQSV